MVAAVDKAVDRHLRSSAGNGDKPETVTESGIRHLSWSEVENEAARIAARAPEGVTDVWGPPMGGFPVATLVAQHLGAKVLLRDPLGTTGRVANPKHTLVVDDLVDSGATLRPFTDAGFTVDAMYRKPHSPLTIAPTAQLADGWLVFPWERDAGPADAVTRLLEYLGENPHRDGLLDTPQRVVRSLREMTSGYNVDVAHLLATTFDEHSDEMVVLSGIEFTSLCEHHMLPFTGKATVGYVPDKRVVGLSKMARLVDAYARRLQVQERMTTQIAEAMWDHLRPLGVGVVLTAHHSCMGVRGVRKPSATMTTSAMLGILKHGDAARSEFLRLANGSP